MPTPTLTYRGGIDAVDTEHGHFVRDTETPTTAEAIKAYGDVDGWEAGERPDGWEPPEPVDPERDEQIAALVRANSLESLQGLATAAGLDASGTKREIAERLALNPSTDPAGDGTEG